MKSNFIITQKNIVNTVNLLNNTGYTALQDVIASDEEEQIIVSNTKDKTYWLISNSTLDVTKAMIQSIHGQTPEIIN